MLIIDKQTRGRHGNKLFHFNTLMQLSSLVNQEPSTDLWDGYNHFEKTCDILTDTPKTREIPFLDLINNSEENLIKKYSKGNWRLHTLSLCGPFFRITKEDPRKFIKLKNSYLYKTDKTSIGIHIRGGDLRHERAGHYRHEKEIHPSEYYINSIDYVVDKYGAEIDFYLCTDDPDPGYSPFYKTLKYLKEKRYSLYFDPSNNYMKDFSILSECDILIAGSSTFVLAAGMIGNYKKIIHSKDFVEQFKEQDQKWYSSYGNGYFFHDLNHKKNKYYNVWKLI